MHSFTESKEAKNVLRLLFYLTRNDKLIQSSGDKHRYVGSGKAEGY